MAKGCGSGAVRHPNAPTGVAAGGRGVGQEGDGWKAGWRATKAKLACRNPARSAEPSLAAAAAPMSVNTTAPSAPPDSTSGVGSRLWLLPVLVMRSSTGVMRIALALPPSCAAAGKQRPASQRPASGASPALLLAGRVASPGPSQSPSAARNGAVDGGWRLAGAQRGERRSGHKQQSCRGSARGAFLQFSA